MKTYTISYTSVALNATGFKSNATGASWPLTNTVVTDAVNCGQQLTIHNDAATDHSGKTALITGLDCAGMPQTETLALPAGTLTTTSTKFWSTATSVVPSATIGADTMDIGWNAVSVTGGSEPMNVAGSTTPFNIGFSVVVTAGSPNYTVQHTYNGSTWFNHATIAAKTDASNEGSYSTPIHRMRMKNTVAGGVTFTFIAAHR